MSEIEQLVFAGLIVGGLAFLGSSGVVARNFHYHSRLSHLEWPVTILGVVVFLAMWVSAAVISG